MLLICGVGIIAAVLLFVCVAAWHKRMSAHVIFALGAVGVIAGIVVTNLPDIVGLVLKSGVNASYGLQLQRVERAAQQVETDTTEVRQMKKQIELIVGRLEKGEQTASQIGNAVQEADKKLKDMQQQQATRRLSDEQKRILVNALSPFRGQKVSLECVLGDDEGYKFAKDFEDVFIRAGWDFGAIPGVSRTSYTRDPIGIEIHLHEKEGDAGRVPQGLDILAETLMQLGILDKRVLFKNAKIPVGEIQLRVGKNPPK